MRPHKRRATVHYYCVLLRFQLICKRKVVLESLPPPSLPLKGLYRCGPASVQAIKHGEICYPFDAGFVFAEVSHPPSICIKVRVVEGSCRESDRSPPPFYPQVNSDVVFYSRGKDGAMQPVRVNQTHVGRLVLTKAAGATTRRDITSQYKFPEGLSVSPKSGVFN